MSAPDSNIEALWDSLGMTELAGRPAMFSRPPLDADTTEIVSTTTGAAGSLLNSSGMVTGGTQVKDEPVGRFGAIPTAVVEAVVNSPES